LIDLEGLMTIEFNTLMKDEMMGFNITNLNSSILNITLDLSQQTVDQSDLQYEQVANLSWEPVSFASNLLKIKLKLAEPLLVSQNKAIDHLVVNFTEPDHFRDQKSQMRLDNLTYVVNYKIPALIPDDI
jgi:hypothetical protein